MNYKNYTKLTFVSPVLNAHMAEVINLLHHNKPSLATFFLNILPEQYNVSVHTQVVCSYKFRYFTGIMQYGYGTENKEAVIGQAYRMDR